MYYTNWKKGNIVRQCFQLNISWNYKKYLKYFLMKIALPMFKKLSINYFELLE